MKQKKENFIDYQNRDNRDLIQQNYNNNKPQNIQRNRSLTQSQSLDFSKSRPQIEESNNQNYNQNVNRQQRNPSANIQHYKAPEKYEVNNFDNFPENNKLSNSVDFTSNKKYDNTYKVVDNAENGYNNNYRLTKDRPMIFARSRKYGQHNEQKNSVEKMDESLRFHPQWADYDRSRFGDYTYNFFLNAPMRGDVTEDWKYPPQYYYTPGANAEGQV